MFFRQKGNAPIIHGETSALPKRGEPSSRKGGKGGGEYETGEIQKWSFNESKQSLEIKSAVLEDRVQVSGELIQVLRGVGRWPCSSSGRSVVLRSLWSVRLLLQVLSSAKDLLAFYEVLVGVAEREADILDLWAHEEQLQNPFESISKTQVPPTQTSKQTNQIYIHSVDMIRRAFSLCDVYFASQQSQIFSFKAL